MESCLIGVICRLQGSLFFKMSGLVDGVLVALFMAIFGVFKGA